MPLHERFNATSGTWENRPAHCLSLTTRVESDQLENVKLGGDRHGTRIIFGGQRSADPTNRRRLYLLSLDPRNMEGRRGTFAAMLASRLNSGTYSTTMEPASGLGSPRPPPNCPTCVVEHQTKRLFSAVARGHVHPGHFIAVMKLGCPLEQPCEHWLTHRTLPKRVTISVYVSSDSRSAGLVFALRPSVSHESELARWPGSWP